MLREHPALYRCKIVTIIEANYGTTRAFVDFVFPSDGFRRQVVGSPPRASRTSASRSAPFNICEGIAVPRIELAFF